MNKENIFTPMGVINITPDSFSDGSGRIERAELFKKVKVFQKYFSALDFGMESTAPQNRAVSLKEELFRGREYFVPLIEIFKPDLLVSIDTYKEEVFFMLYEELRKQGGKSRKIIWNDVSGHIPPSLYELLKKDENLSYVFCHSLVPRRELSSDHRNFLFTRKDNSDPTSTSEVLRALEDFFSEGLKKLRGLSLQIILDPAFGFSKDAQISHQIWRELPNLLLMHSRWLLGISRKSFLREMLRSQGGEVSVQNLDLLQEKMYAELKGEVMQNETREIFIRIHGPFQNHAI